MVRPRPPLRSLRSQRDAVQVFARQPSPRIIATGLIGALALRARDHRFDRRDGAIVAAVVTTRGLHEWVIHRFVLHAAPRDVLGVTIDPGAGHRAHHDHPDTIDDALLKPRDAVLFLAMIAVYVGGACGPWRHRLAPRNTLTGVATAYAALLTYEWTHYLDHTTVPLRSRVARQLRAHHRLHHYRDERAWLGITSTIGDRVFRTSPPSADERTGQRLGV